jgi:hypothetical protein
MASVADIRVADIRRDLAEVVGRFEAATLLSSDAAAVVAEAVRIKNLAATLEMLAAKRVADSGLWKARGYRSPADWLAGESKQPLGEAIGSLEAAEVLDSCPGTAEKARAGELSAPQTRALAQAVAADPASENRLLGVAERDGLRKLRQQCDQVRHCREDDVARHERVRRNRHVRHWTDPDGAFRLSASLTPIAGAKLLGALTPFERQAFDTARRDDRVERSDALRADALEAMCDRLLSGDVDSSESPRTRRPAYVAVVDALALQRGHARPGERCTIAGVGDVPVAALREHAPDAVWHALVADGVDVLAYASMRRHVPDFLKLALTVREPECAVPGCNQTLGLELDHVEPFAEGGPTSAGNLAPLCHFHHAQKTYEGYRLIGPPGARQWLPPDRLPDTG